jgi:exopolysaccharide biosynthesis polyprenyl glycosylphosphotransferase
MLSNRKTLQYVCALVELGAIALAWRIAVELRVAANPFMAVSFDPHRAGMWAPPLLWILAVWLVVVAWFKPYARPEATRFWAGMVAAAECALAVSGVAIAVTFFSRGIGADTSRSFVLCFIPAVTFLMILSRAGCVALSVALGARLRQSDGFVLLAPKLEASRVLEQMRFFRDDVRFRGVVIPEGSDPLETGEPVPVLGTTRQLAEVINREGVSRMVLLNGSMSDTEVAACNRISRRMGVPISYTLALAAPSDKINFSMEYGVPVLEFVPVKLDRWQQTSKRVLDVVVSAITLVALAPLMLIITLLVKLTSNGPVLYRSPRVGKGGRYFTFLKFRSMYTGNGRHEVAAGNEKDGHIFKVRNDPRITPIGRFLRRYSLDELPQLFNVLRGDMSVVGPRPLPAEDLDPDGMSRRFEVWSEQRSRVRPGITGLWQIRGRSELPFEDMIKYDLEYILNWSLTLDIRILLETPAFVVSGQGAY